MTEPILIDEAPGANIAETSCSTLAATAAAAADMRRKEKRKVLKKDKRKQKRKELAEKARQEEESRLNDPEELRRIEMEEEREKERLERERREFEERERMFLEQLAERKAREEEEEERRRAQEEAKLKPTQAGDEVNEDDDWEYIEEGPPEIIWQGNEIILKKNKVRVKKKDAGQRAAEEDPNRPTSNPLPPQSEAFSEYKHASVPSAQQLLDDIAQQTPNYGTEQDKAHCPFHIKTGACRFGPRCSRVHLYPDKSCTLLIRNMYSGPGLAWEQDEGLEHTDEEVERCYEEFYEDVHTEFLKFGEIINFKVCRNSSSHLRGNVYVHYKSLDSAVLAYHAINGRYFAGKQVACEFVNISRWKVAICGEYMKSKLKTCSRGSTCNFIHCFRNPGGDYEWADWDKPPPRYWIKKMAALFGHFDEDSYGKQVEQESLMQVNDGSKMSSAYSNRYRSRRSKERESSYRSSKSHHGEHDVCRSSHRPKHSSPRDYHHGKGRFRDSESDIDWSDKDGVVDRHHDGDRRRSRTPRLNSELQDCQRGSKSRDRNADLDSDFCDQDAERHRGHLRKRSRHEDEAFGNLDTCSKSKARRTESSREQSSKDRHKEMHHSAERGTRGHHDEVLISPDDHWDGVSRTRDSDHSADWSEEATNSRHTDLFDSSVHSNLASEVSDDEETSNGEHFRRTYGHAKSRRHGPQKRNCSRGRDCSSLKDSKTDKQNKHIHGKRSSSRHDVEKDNDERPSHQYQEARNLHDTKSHFNGILDENDRFEPQKVDTRKHKKHRRKSRDLSGERGLVVCGDGIAG